MTGHAQPRARATAAAAAVAVALLAAACDGDDPRPETTAATVTTAPSADPDATSPTTRAGEGQPPHPAVIRPYSAGTAGRVVIAYEEGRMSLVGVDPTDGWAHRVVAEQPRRIAVRFTADDGRRVSFTARVRDDAVAVDLRRTPAEDG